MLATRGGLAVATFTLVMAMAASCVDPTKSPDGQASLNVTADVTGTSVATVVVEVTAPDIATPLVFNLTILNGIASGTITLPSGSGRTIAIRAFDAGGVETHRGSVTVDVQSGANATVSLVLTPLTGDIPIQATLGTVTVTVAPPSSILSLGSTTSTVQLTVTLLDAQGQPATGAVSWATHDPGVAVVDANGLVSAVRVGQTNVVATFRGAVGSAAITVTP
jgi:Bacterial Ig-like domain (group 2)